MLYILKGKGRWDVVVEIQIATMKKTKKVDPLKKI